MRTASLTLVLLVFSIGGCHRAIGLKSTSNRPESRVNDLSAATTDDEVAAAMKALRFEGAQTIAPLKAALAQTDSRNRPEMTLVLGRIPDDAATPILTGLLSDPDSRVRATAMYGLSFRTSKSELPELHKLAASAVQSDREWALYALDKLQDPRAKPLFLQACQAPDPSIRAQGARGLRNFAGPDVVSELLKSMHDANYETRMESVISLCRVDPTNPVVTKYLKDFDATSNLDSTAQLKGRAAVYGEMRHPISENLLATMLLTAKEPEVRQAAADNYPRLKAIHDAKPLIKAFTDDPGWSVRMSAGFAMEALKPKEALPALVQSASSSDRTEVSEAAGALAALDSTAAVPTLKELASSGSDTPAIYAAAGLLNLHIEDPNAQARYKELIEDAASSDPHRRMQAALLDRFNDPKSLQVLRKLSDDQNPLVRFGAVLAVERRTGEPLYKLQKIQTPPSSWLDADRTE